MPELYPPPPGGPLDSPELTAELVSLALFYVDRAHLGTGDFRLRRFLERAAWEIRESQKLKELLRLRDELDAQQIPLEGRNLWDPETQTLVPPLDFEPKPKDPEPVDPLNRPGFHFGFSVYEPRDPTE